ncbi:MAG TPA: sulfatase-like hydrolase/transferase, partial [Chloroflexota bacterium]|nr:sulfatase-like hydrolase/transferase [Chloroflexota bacterium]
GNTHFPAEHRLLPRRLADAGYDCGLSGKLHLAGAAWGREPRIDDGYRYFQYSHAPRHDWPKGHDYADWLAAQGHDPGKVMAVRSKRQGPLHEPDAEHDNTPVELHQTHWCVEKALEFIAEPRTGSQPWLLSVNPYYPHPPFNPPWEYYRRYDPAALPGPHFRESDLETQRRLAEGGVDFQSAPKRPEEFQAQKVQAAYYAQIELLDAELGRLLEALDRSGERERTVIVFTSDHGEALGDHGLTQKGCRFYDGLVRVPLIWSLPGTIQQGLVSDALVELTDIAPTLYELVGLPIPEDTQGRSLLSILTGRAPAGQHREFVRSEYYDAVELPNHTFGTMYRDRRWKLVVYHGLEVGELYDMQTDPWEHENLWDSPEAEHQRVKTDLLKRSFDATVRAMDYGPKRIMPS